MPTWRREVAAEPGVRCRRTGRAGGGDHQRGLWHHTPPAGNAATAGAARASAARTTHPTATTTTVGQLAVAPLSWTPCNGDLQCATLVVPLNYADPRGPTIPIEVERHLAEVPGARIGSLVIDPGGPGVSGIDDMANELDSLTPQLRDDFDIVMFDPRGVERSDPVQCDPAPGEPATSTDPVPTTPAQQKTTMAGYRQFAADCLKTAPTLLPSVGTVNVARDMDRLRQALGDATLTYMGQSYGSLLGLTYAGLFPTHVRAMVLDGVIDPALTFDQMTAGQAEGFESALSAFFAWCAGSSSCSWHWTGDPTAALLTQLATAAASPAPADGGKAADAGTLYDALLGGLYARSDWPRLADALAADVAGDGGPAESMSTHYERNGSSNGEVASVAIDCLDHPVSHDVDDFATLSDSLRTSAPVFGPLLAWGEAACAAWPAPPTRTVGPVRAAGAPPILLIGTTADPATPYAWAVGVSHELNKSTLLTLDGDSHVAYFYSSCVRDDVQAYFVGGVTPAPGATCTS